MSNEQDSDRPRPGPGNEADTDESQTRGSDGKGSSSDGSDDGDSDSADGEKNYGADEQDLVDRSKIDFDPDDGLFTGTAIDGSTEIPGPHEQADDVTDDDGGKEDADSDDDSDDRPGNDDPDVNGTERTEAARDVENNEDRPKPGSGTAT